MATSPKCPRGSYEEVNDVTRKLGETGPSGIWPLLQYIPQLKTVLFDNFFRDYIFSLGYQSIKQAIGDF